MNNTEYPQTDIRVGHWWGDAPLKLEQVLSEQWRQLDHFFDQRDEGRFLINVFAKSTNFRECIGNVYTHSL